MDRSEDRTETGTDTFQRLRASVRRNWKLKVGAFSILMFVSFAFLCPVLLDYSEEVTKQHASEKFKAPGVKHWFGTDNFGRDIFSRVVWGSRYALSLGASAVILGLLIGVPLGMFSGYWGGWRDQLLMRINDAFLSLPGMVLALVIIATLGSSMFNAVLAIGITFAPRISRVMRSCTISLINEQFVTAAKARGESDFYIIFREILPNALGPIIVEGGIRISYAIVLGASLSFLGLGAQPPQPDWGLMIYEARRHIFMASWTLIFPSIALILIVLSFNFLGDGLRDMLDPKETELRFSR
jgi:peptide/nickel transport system permease protein